MSCSVQYDLVTQPWLPCRDLAGRSVELGLRDVLLRAHELADLEAPGSPLVTGALLRLLLAVVHDVLEGPATVEDRLALWRAGRFDPDLVDAYFTRWRDRFDLFSPDRPFYQTAGFAVDEPKTVARLAAELGTGNNPTLFDHTLDAEPPAVEPAVAARGLVAFQIYALGHGGLPQSNLGKHTAAKNPPAVAGVNLFLLGESLFQTLCLNLLSAEDRPLGVTHSWSVPIWRRDNPPSLGPRVPEGYLDYLTWPNRHVRLVPELDGDRLVVRGIHPAQGAEIPKDVTLRDPFFAMRPRKDEVSLPLRVTQDRALWRDSTVLFGSTCPVDTKRLGQRPRPEVFEAAQRFLKAAEDEMVDLPGPFRCRAVGLDFDKGKINLWRVETLPVPPVLLSDGDVVDKLTAAVRCAEDVASALHGALRRMAGWLISPGDGQADKNQVAAVVDSWHAESVYWSRVGQGFDVLVLGLASDPDAALPPWREACARAALDAFDEVARQHRRDHKGLQAQVRSKGILMATIKGWLPQRKEVLDDVD